MSGGDAGPRGGTPAPARPAAPGGARSRLRDLDPRALADPHRRQDYVTTMFEEIAPRYDGFTRRFSLGMDRRWKEDLVAAAAAAAPVGPLRGLDLACGTGDLAVALCQALPGLEMEGIDVAAEMIARARPHPRVRYRVGDGMRLAAADGTIGVVSVGYGLRNFPDYRASLAEIARVLAPGGVVAVLDFTRPRFAPWRWLFLAYLWLSGTLVGWWWHGHGPVYSYIAGSIARFATRRELLADLDRAGLTPVCAEGRLGGGIALIVARRR